ncbi:MAG: N-acetylglucosamine-6-phosphate deacetylase [Clostridia bacterium]|nr:N-acetylglucosamine-6-phosphate deacetylase [Clostridia bacterium]
MRRVYKNAVVGGKIQDIVTEEGKIAFVGEVRDPGINLLGKALRPGLYDIHCHGCMGEDAGTGEKAVLRMAKEMGKRGITSFLPTLGTISEEDIARAVCRVPKTEGAKVRGFHMEGPYIALSRKGAQDPRYVLTPEGRSMKEYPTVRLVNVAPEIPGAEDFIRQAVSRGVRVALGHTDADYDTCRRAFAAGATSLTHTFNAMPGFFHRAPGPVGAALTGDGYVQVIADGIHLHPAVILGLYRMFGASRMILISDMIPPCGLPDGETFSLGLPVTVKNGEARLHDGTLAGSSVFLDDMVRRAISFGIPTEDAFRMASETPAAYMGDLCGKIEIGFDADFGVWDGLSLLGTVVDGEPAPGFPF